MTSTDTPKISVLMTCYNAALTIEASVRSIIAQTFTNWELVLVDNCSTDNSLAVVQKFQDSRIRIIALETNHGRTGALNIALNSALAEFVAILDADDISDPERLQMQNDYLDNNSKVVAVGSWYRNIDRDGKLLSKVKTPTSSINIVRQLASDNPIVNSSAMFRSESARSLGGYNPKYLYSQDLDLWLGLATLGEFAILPRYLTSIRRTATSLTNTPHFGLARTCDLYILYRRAQGLDGLRVIDRLKGKRTIGLCGLLYAWQSLRAGNIVRAVGLIITNLWAIPLAIIELLRKGFNSIKSV